MDDARVTRILILAEPDAARSWAEILRGPQTVVWPGRSAIPPGEHPDLIVAQARAEPIPARDFVGLVQIGGGGPADAVLPADCSPGELRRTCRLLGEVVELRRRQYRALRIRRKLTRAAMTDSLTGLANRRAWDQELARRLADGTAGQRLCVALLDLDQFKEVNDLHGHAAGDRLLQDVSRTLAENLRQDDFVARLGGDEFGIVLGAPDEATATAIIERLRRQIAKTAGRGSLFPITASAGLALGGREGDTCDSLLMAADAALLAAKRMGRNRLGGST
jgi:diguanylate cyclase (GGDEF)-like protein